MKRDWEIICKILIALEENPHDKILTLKSFPNENPAVISYNMELLISEGIVKGKILDEMRGYEPQDFVVENLTFKGNDLLSSNCKQGVSKRSEIVNNQKEFYVSVDRIKELKGINKSKFDFTRLIRLCEELNIAYQNKCYMSIVMIVRSIINHIPPIFGANKFSEVANNYGGGTSFKKLAGSLNENLRKIADFHLHTQIREKEILPTDIQVDFKQSLDMILSEIVRIT